MSEFDVGSLLYSKISLDFEAINSYVVMSCYIWSPLQLVRPDHVRRRTWSGGPSTALYMVRPDHSRRRTWSGRTIHGAVDGPLSPYNVPTRTMYSAMDGPLCHIIYFSTIHGVANSFLSRPLAYPYLQNNRELILVLITTIMVLLI